MSKDSKGSKFPTVSQNFFGQLGKRAEREDHNTKASFTFLACDIKCLSCRRRKGGVDLGLAAPVTPLLSMDFSTFKSRASPTKSSKTKVSSFRRTFFKQPDSPSDVSKRLHSSCFILRTVRLEEALKTTPTSLPQRLQTSATIQMNEPVIKRPNLQRPDFMCKQSAQSGIQPKHSKLPPLVPEFATTISVRLHLLFIPATKQSDAFWIQIS